MTPEEIDLTKPIDPENPQSFWRGSFTFEDGGGKTSYREPDRPNKSQVAYPNRLDVYMSRRKALEVLTVLSSQLAVDDGEDCVVGFYGELLLDPEDNDS